MGGNKEGSIICYSKSAAGPDLINYWILSNLPDIAIVKLAEIFSMIIIDGSYPSSWQEFDTVLIPKQGKLSLRPISLASCLLKIFEKSVKKRLDRFIELDCILPNSQFGFRRGRSCDHCIIILNTDIYKSFIKGQVLGAVFLDIEGAYDNVDLYKLFQIINQFKIPPGYKSFLRNFLGPRTVNFYENGILYDKRVVYKGLPQRSVLSPLLFNVYVKDILLHVPYSCTSIQFADEFVIWSSGFSVD